MIKFFVVIKEHVTILIHSGTSRKKGNSTHRHFIRRTQNNKLNQFNMARKSLNEEHPYRTNERQKHKAILIKKIQNSE